MTRYLQLSKLLRRPKLTKIPGLLFLLVLSPGKMASNTRPVELSRPVNELHLAAYRDSVKQTVALLSSGLLGIDQGDPQGWSPLMYCAFYGSPQVAQVLVNGGANVSTAADDGATALHLSSQEGHLYVTRLLLKSGADLEALNSDGVTPLYLASEHGRVAVLSALIEAGANPDARASDDGRTPLYMAADRGHAGAVRVLLQANANALLPKMVVSETVGGSSRRKLVPLEIAVRYGRAGVVHELLQQLGIQGCGGPTAAIVSLRVAVDWGRGSPRLVRSLVDQGVDVQAIVIVFYDPCPAAPEGEALLDPTKLPHVRSAEGQLNDLQGIRRLLLRAEALHSCSWLWHTTRGAVARDPDSTQKRKTASKPLTVMLPVLRRRAARRGVLVVPVSRW